MDQSGQITSMKFVMLLPSPGPARSTMEQLRTTLISIGESEQLISATLHLNISRRLRNHKSSTESTSSTASERSATSTGRTPPTSERSSAESSETKSSTD